jgi:ribosome-binding ATPase
MKLKSGIVGLPNVGKSTLFNALVENSSAQAANFPFCTIEPNVGIAVVPDDRLDVLKVINESVKVVPTTLEFVDIAGLVAGASKGEGLGNQFLANIRECDAIVHVVRCFDDENIIHVAGSVDPMRDIEIINLELTLSDLAQVEKRLKRAKASRGKSDASPDEISALEKLLVTLDDGQLARLVDLTEDEKAAIKALGLLTMKPVVYAANVQDSDLADGNTWVESVKEYAATQGAKTVIVSAQVESELVALTPEDRVEFLEALGVTEESTGLRALVAATYDLLGLRTYFTSGPTETRAWTITAGMRAPQAAGVIHSDFERGFIRAETIGYKDLCAVGSEKAAKEKGLMRSEGKEYEVAEGDVLLFRFNV